VNIRVIANCCAAVILVVGLAGYLASGSAAFGLAFIAGSLFLFAGTFLSWIVFGNPTSWSEAPDLKRADGRQRDQSSILPPHWPGQS
jgi:hypothetical protein